MYHTTKVRICCLLWMFVDVGNWHLIWLSIKDCMFVTSTTKNSAWCSTTKFDSNRAYSWASTSFDYWCWLVIHIIPLGWLFIQPQTRMDFSTPCRSHQLNHILPCINNLFSYQLHMFFNKHFFTSKMQRGNKTRRFICYFFHSWFITFIIHGKIGNPVYKKNLGYLHLFCGVWGFISLNVWEHHIISCIILGIVFLKSRWVGALFLDFHSGCAISAGLVVFWVLLQLNYQFVPKKITVSSKIIKFKENPWHKFLSILNFMRQIFPSPRVVPHL